MGEIEKRVFLLFPFWVFSLVPWTIPEPKHNVIQIKARPVYVSTLEFLISAISPQKDTKKTRTDAVTVCLQTVLFYTRLDDGYPLAGWNVCLPTLTALMISLSSNTRSNVPRTASFKRKSSPLPPSSKDPFFRDPKQSPSPTHPSNPNPSPDRFETSRGGEATECPRTHGGRYAKRN